MGKRLGSAQCFVPCYLQCCSKPAPPESIFCFPLGLKSCHCLPDILYLYKSLWLYVSNLPLFLECPSLVFYCHFCPNVKDLPSQCSSRCSSWPCAWVRFPLINPSSWPGQPLSAVTYCFHTAQLVFFLHIPSCLKVIALGVHSTSANVWNPLVTWCRIAEQGTYSCCVRIRSFCNMFVLSCTIL